MELNRNSNNIDVISVFNVTMKAAQIVTPKKPLEIKDLETPKPRGSQVLVKVQSSGVCHSDIHLWE
ncbi:MAG TPA: hypothetical protein VIY08_13670, partial [Candidatus Nitrosocosmicus sp.]